MWCECCKCYYENVKKFRNENVGIIAFTLFIIGVFSQINQKMGTTFKIDSKWNSKKFRYAMAHYKLGIALERIVEIDINSFEDKYGDYLSQEQLAREYYVSTGNITSWIKKGKINPTVAYPFGNKQINLFSPEDVKNIRNELNIPEHTEETIKKDFFDFLAERDYSLSYKMPFLL